MNIFFNYEKSRKRLLSIKIMLVATLYCTFIRPGENRVKDTWDHYVVFLLTAWEATLISK